MSYYFFIIPFHIIIHNFLFNISNAIPSVEDNMLIAFMKGHQETQLSEYSMQKYEAHLGILYFMRMNWQCEKIHEKFKEYERTECQKYRKYLDILYEYLCKEYAGIPTVKPKFVFKDDNIKIEIKGPIIYAMNCFVKISQFYFIKSVAQKYEYKLNELFNSYFNYEPKLLNEKRLNYEPKLPINEMILQLAIDTANEWQTNESLHGILRENFEENLKEMFKNAIEDCLFGANKINEDKHLLISFTKFDDSYIWSIDAHISKIVKKVPQKYHCNNELGIAYFMRKNWHCAKISGEFEEECQKYRKYLRILYEYLFRIYVEDKNVDLVNKLPAVKPIFVNNFNNRLCLEEVIKILIGKSKCEPFSEFAINSHISLLNEEEFEIKEEENGGKKGKQILNEPSADIEKTYRNEFDEKMENFYINAKECRNLKNPKLYTSIIIKRIFGQI